jgi:hypothetical protein
MKRSKIDRLYNRRVMVVVVVKKISISRRGVLKSIYRVGGLDKSTCIKR